MLEQPFLSVAKAAEKSGASFPAVNGAMKHLEALGIAREVTGKTRNRLYVYDKYLTLLSQGTEPL
jgi:Fic family protein